MVKRTCCSRLREKQFMVKRGAIRSYIREKHTVVKSSFRALDFSCSGFWGVGRSLAIVGSWQLLWLVVFCFVASSLFSIRSQESFGKKKKHWKIVRLFSKQKGNQQQSTINGLETIRFWNFRRKGLFDSPIPQNQWKLKETNGTITFECP